jgi:serine protease AprX
VDFTGSLGSTGDKYGHGTHVAGIHRVGPTVSGDAVGVAPGVLIASLRVLDAHGEGVASSVIAAIDWAIANQRRFNIRVINASLGAPATQSYQDDPIDQAVERAYRAGILVIASAGNFGRRPTAAPSTAPSLLPATRRTP